VSSLDATLATNAGRTGPADDRPLNAEEYALLQRLLSDPFSIPIQFKTWLVSYLETSDMTLPISAISGLKSILGITGVGSGTLGILPAGLIFPFGGLSAPSGSKLCDGTAYSRSVEARLFAAIGTAYGAPDGSSFNVPDLQGRIPVGRGANSDVDTLGKTESPAVLVANRRPKHRHSPHTHSFPTPFVAKNANPSTGGAGDAGGDRSQFTVSGTGATDGGTGVGSDPLDTPAFQVVNFIIIS
jgi:microcystin-dependent protein